MATNSRLHRKGVKWQPVSKYCEECLKFRRTCKGKEQSQKAVLFFGSRGDCKKLKAGLNFCKLYEFDVRLYRFADGSKEVGTIETVRKRQVERDEEIFNEETFDDFDRAANLSSADFEI